MYRLSKTQDIYFLLQTNARQCIKNNNHWLKITTLVIIPTWLVNRTGIWTRNIRQNSKLASSVCTVREKVLKHHVTEACTYWIVQLWHGQFNTSTKPCRGIDIIWKKVREKLAATCDIYSRGSNNIGIPLHNPPGCITAA